MMATDFFISGAPQAEHPQNRDLNSLRAGSPFKNHHDARHDTQDCLMDGQPLHSRGLIFPFASDLFLLSLGPVNIEASSDSLSLAAHARVVFFNVAIDPDDPELVQSHLSPHYIQHMGDVRGGIEIRACSRPVGTFTSLP